MVLGLFPVTQASVNNSHSRDSYHFGFRDRSPQHDNGRQSERRNYDNGGRDDGFRAVHHGLNGGRGSKRGRDGRCRGLTTDGTMAMGVITTDGTIGDEISCT